MSEVEAPAEQWEVTKENFQPLKRGREAKSLGQQSQMAPKAETEEIEARRRCSSSVESNIAVISCAGGEEIVVNVFNRLNCRGLLCFAGASGMSLLDTRARIPWKFG